MEFRRSGRELVTGSWDGTVRLWNLSDGRSEILMRHTDCIYAVAVSPDGATLACGAYDGAVKLLDLSTRRERAALKGHTGPVLSLAFSKDGKLLVSGGADQTVRLWRRRIRRRSGRSKRFLDATAVTLAQLTLRMNPANGPENANLPLLT